MGNKIESASPIGKQTTKERQQKNREIRKLKSLTRLKPDPNKKKPRRKLDQKRSISATLHQRA